MGGNSRAIDRKTGEIIAKAEILHLSEIEGGRFQLCLDLTKLFGKIVSGLTYHSVPHLEEDGVFFIPSRFFSGSSSHLFDFTIPEAELLQYKEAIGDIDYMIPIDQYLELTEFLQSHEGHKLTKKFRYLGQDRDNFGHTFLGIFEYDTGTSKVNLQIDFESADCDGEGEPSEWAKFSHSSSWNDVKAGLKGFHHKALLTNIVRAISTCTDSILCTPASTYENFRVVTGKRANEIPRRLAFSVDRGLREKYVPILDVEGNPMAENGKILLKEVDSEKSVYITDLKKMFELIFGQYEEKDFEKMHSTLGLLELCKTRLTEEQRTSCFKYCIELSLFGTAQRVDKWNYENDRRVKLALVEKFAEHWNTDTEWALQRMKEYYSDEK